MITVVRRDDVYVIRQTQLDANAKAAVNSAGFAWSQEFMKWTLSQNPSERNERIIAKLFDNHAIDHQFVDWDPSTQPKKKKKGKGKRKPAQSKSKSKPTPEPKQEPKVEKKAEPEPKPKQGKKPIRKAPKGALTKKPNQPREQLSCVVYDYGKYIGTEEKLSKALLARFKGLKKHGVRTRYNPNPGRRAWLKCSHENFIKWCAELGITVTIEKATPSKGKSFGNKKEKQKTEAKPQPTVTTPEKKGKPKKSTHKQQPTQQEPSKITGDTIDRAALVLDLESVVEYMTDSFKHTLVPMIREAIADGTKEIRNEFLTALSEMRNALKELE